MSLLKKVVSLALTVCLMTTVLIACGQPGNSTPNASNTGSGENSNEQDHYVMRIMHAYSTTCNHQYNMEKLAELMDEYTDGRIEVQIFPNSQLGAIDKEVGMCQSGAVEAAYSINGNLETICPEEAIYTLPYFWETEPGYSPEYWEATAPYGVFESWFRDYDADYGIYRYSSINTQNGQFIAANNKHAVEVPEDMQGLKLRHSGGMLATLTLESQGAIAITMSGADVPIALSQNTIDGVVSAVSHYHDTGWHTKYATLSYNKCYSLPLIGNLAWFESLPEDLQTIIRDQVIPELSEYANETVSAKELSAIDEMQAEPYNVQVTLIDPEEMRTTWAEYGNIREEALKMYLDETGADGKMLVEEALKLKADLGHEVPDIQDILDQY